MEYVIKLNPDGTVGKAINVKFYNHITKSIGNETFKVDVDINPLILDFKIYEKKIVENIMAQNKVMSLTRTDLDVTIFSFEVVTVAVAHGTVNGEVIIFAEPFANSPTYYVGGRLMERHEVLSHLKGDLTKLKSLPEGYKGITNCVPSAIFPFNEKENIFIERSKLVLTY